MQPLTLAVVFVGVLYVTTFLTVSSTQNNARLTLFDHALAALSFVCSIYLTLQTARYVEWVAGISEFTALDLTVGTVVVLLTSRRCSPAAAWAAYRKWRWCRAGCSA